MEIVDTSRKENCKYYLSCLRQAALLDQSGLPCKRCENYKFVKSPRQINRVLSPASLGWGLSRLPEKFGEEEKKDGY